MKWLFILFSIFKPLFSAGGSHEMPNPIEDLKDLVKKNAVKVMLAFGFMSALATIFAAGLLMITVDISAQYDQNAYVVFSTMILSGIILMLVPVIIGVILVKKYDNYDNEDEKRKPSQQIGAVHPLQDALALLIQDFVKEREMRRMQTEVGLHGAPALDKNLKTTNAADSRISSADDLRH